MLPIERYRVHGQFINYGTDSLILFGEEHIQVSDLNPGLAFMTEIENSLIEKLLANQSIINHILMPARSFVLLNNAGCLSLERVSRFCNEFVETLVVPNVGFREFKVIALPISLAPVTMMVYVIEDSLYDLINPLNEEYQFIPTPHLFHR